MIFFYTDNIEATPENVKLVKKAKFEPKVMMWIAISSKAISTPYLKPVRGPPVDCDAYIGNCLSKLKLLIQKYHARDNFIFWPDLARCHCAKKHKNGIEYFRNICEIIFKVFI